MNAKQRIDLTCELKQADRPPIFGGWLAAPAHIQALTGCSEDEYWADPFKWGIEVEKVLGSDAAVTSMVPKDRHDFRIVDQGVLERRASYTIESVLAEIEAMPDAEESRRRFDEDKAYSAYVRELKRVQDICGKDLVWCPADWDMIPKALWVSKYGYETSMLTMALNPEPWQKLMRASAEIGRQHSVLIARTMKEGLRPKIILTGEDICSQQGPMVSPDFLRKELFPLVEMSMEPINAVGGKIIWHCDGNCRPIMDDLLACGVGGFQGFQQECGMDIEWIVKLRSRKKEQLIIMGPMSVTQTLPFGKPGDIKAEVERAIKVCRGEALLTFFTSNTINPDCPLENIKAFWKAVLSSKW